MVQNTEFKDFYEKLQDADLVLVGLGEEFDDVSMLRKIPGYLEMREKLEDNGLIWLLPAVNECYRKKNPARASEIRSSLERLCEILEGKNYFVLTTSVNDVISQVNWREKRLVRPCGGGIYKQCAEGCEGAVTEVLEEEKAALLAFLEKLCGSESKDVSLAEAEITGILGTCPICGKPYILNNVYAENYDESGYGEQWRLYTRWLQGTINKKLVVLELGVGMKYPSVIRWPFEKIAFFNQKSSFYRVHESLYQTSAELAEKSSSFAKNAIDWLNTI